MMRNFRDSLAELASDERRNMHHQLTAAAADMGTAQEKSQVLRAGASEEPGWPQLAASRGNASLEPS